MRSNSANKSVRYVLGVLSLLVGHGTVTTAAAEVPAPERVPVVAVAQLESKGVPPEQVDVIADNLAIRLQQTGKLRVMERSQMGRILQEQNFQQSGACDGSECAVQIGKILGIDRIVVGSVGLVGSTYSLSLRLVDVSTGEALKTTARNSKGTIDIVLTDLVPMAATDLVEGDGKQQKVADADTTKSRTVWPWVVGGVALVGGGVAAALLLAGDESSPASSDGGQTPVVDDHLKFTW